MGVQPGPGGGEELVDAPGHRFQGAGDGAQLAALVVAEVGVALVAKPPVQGRGELVEVPLLVVERAESLHLGGPGGLPHVPGPAGSSLELAGLGGVELVAAVLGAVVLHPEPEVVGGAVDLAGGGELGDVGGAVAGGPPVELGEERGPGPGPVAFDLGGGVGGDACLA